MADVLVRKRLQHPRSESTLNLTSKREHQQRCCTRECLAHLAYFRGRTASVTKAILKRPQVEAERSIQRSMAIFVGGGCQSQTDVDITRFLLIDNIKNLETNNSLK